MPQTVAAFTDHGRGWIGCLNGAASGLVAARRLIGLAFAVRRRDLT
jgi:hypothetical protein